jgi:hypothetical protein
MTDTSNDLSIVFYTAHVVEDKFFKAVMDNLLEVKGDLPLIIIPLHDQSKRSHFQIYRQALEGAKQATTKYIGLAEDDMLYTPAHFEYRPRKKPFAYNLSYWGIYTWQDPPMYNYKGRRNLGNLICEREAFIEAMEERFQKYSDPTGEHLKDIWGEPSKYERQLGITIREAEDFYSQPPNIKFSHPTELSFAGLGTRKRAGELRAYDIPHWGSAQEIRDLYG